jgi:5'-nucleotidase
LLVMRLAGWYDRDRLKPHKTMDRKLILLTNDDGIESPGLWAAAEALSDLGFVTVAAPRDQRSGSGRSMPPDSDGSIRQEQVTVGGKTWQVFAVGGSPAQAVQHGILELLPRPPDLVVAGINYGENVSVSVTISGTVGAALEGAAAGIPAMAVSLEVDSQYHLSYSRSIDFSVAAHFARFFAGKMLSASRMHDLDVLKVDVPCDASLDTPWRVTRLSRTRYYIPVEPRRASLSEPAKVGYRVAPDFEHMERDSDVYVLRVERQVSVTPISLDMTSRQKLAEIDQALRCPA